MNCPALNLIHDLEWNKWNSHAQLSTDFPLIEQIMWCNDESNKHS